MSYRSVFRENLFADRNIIVTGGGSGIGRCTAHELAALGARVVLIGRSEDKLREVAGEIQQDTGREALYFSCDIREEERVRATVARIYQAVGQVHGLVNNAGGQFPAPLALISQKGWETVIRTNLTGGFLMAREVFTQGMNQHGGAIVNIVADMWGGMPGMGHSGAARAGMDNFTKTASVEWGCCGVRVNAVAPGWIASSGMDTYPEAFQNILKTLRAAVPLKRMGVEAEVSSAICFLLSDAAAFISGDTLRIDGGASQGNVAIFPLPEHKRSEPFDGFHRAITPAIFKQD
ncbi:SDR family oxidoreductase [Alloalcanivorax xenomutans]|jgi:citronellol/citronellal dehydrogenase|uniref:Peroxisomal trans-2-enoyl-CoA reductase n=1 Tax=Alloalcanivorax xenomutans TaxID=1094342 RepID=A0A9Q3W3C6_9GAMM|nr:SDR family oxidoreductase [Alloalcanivorax xenomutans]ERS14546.1 2,4-dienoyl-CoA reductase [Alcanivorax sp. PN-3]KYZ88264.1 2,4-dienoyl-CoA reductase [Alcanivorax sp. KX64203]MBA4722729.1 SDR family oxidoreductase [Alcanivorax sp.]ARB45462.1 2,4-dienoyl-CoA reductase [Alloalcanivorax xenomutans]MCE7507739.1 SDR family oxidoreductase [Alloalcanivorax xenomutans]